MKQNIYFREIFNVKLEYDVDVVLCIDATASMSPVIDMVKKNIRKLPNDILEEAQKRKKLINSLRVRLIVFRDYCVDGEHAMEATDFFQIPEEQDLFNRVVNGIVADGGGDVPENGLEALAYAMTSDWHKEEQGKRRRQIILVWTDASPHTLGYGCGSAFYDPNMPADFETLSDWWGDVPEDDHAKMNYYAKRLMLVAPNIDWWKEIGDRWENVICLEPYAEQELMEHQIEKMIRSLL